MKRKIPGENTVNHLLELDREDERFIRIQLFRFRMFYKSRTGHDPDDKLIEKERKKIIQKNFLTNKEGMSQSEKEDRQIKCLLEVLKHDRRHMTLDEMSQCLVSCGFTVGSSVKTIYRRILPVLEKHGLLKDADKKYYIPEYKREPELERRAADEMKKRMETVSIISNFLDTLKDTPVYEKAKEYIDSEFRFSRYRLHRRGKENFSDNFLASRVIFMGSPAANITSEFWEMLHYAMMENYYVKIQYVAEGRTAPQSYIVSPYQLIFDNGFWELWGDCTSPNHRGTRLFNLTRILDVEVLEHKRKFELPELYDFRSTLAGSFGCYNDNVALDYRLKIAKDSYAYAYIKDRIWGEFQEIKKVKDGYILEFEATQYKPILRWVLSWGSAVIPLEPPQLVKDWKKEIEKMNKVFKE